MIGHVDFLSHPHHNYTLSDRFSQFNNVFCKDNTCTIDHVIILSTFHDKPHCVLLVMTV